MPIFSASVQYDDFKGSVAADSSDNKALLDHLNQLDLVQPGERVVGCRFSFNENPGHQPNPSIIVYLRAGTHDDPAATIRAIEVDMRVAELFTFFKRFDLVMTIDGNTFDGVEIDGPRYE